VDSCRTRPGHHLGTPQLARNQAEHHIRFESTVRGTTATAERLTLTARALRYVGAVRAGIRAADARTTAVTVLAALDDSIAALRW
jgi:hypothetical protein